MTAVDEVTEAAEIAAVALAAWCKGKPASRRRNPAWAQVDVPFKPGEGKAAAKALIRAVKGRQWNRFRSVALEPMGTYVMVAACGPVKVRGVAQYMIGTDETLMRLDVIGARA